jgi:hypothetical protein
VSAPPAAPPLSPASGGPLHTGAGPSVPGADLLAGLPASTASAGVASPALTAAQQAAAVLAAGAPAKDAGAAPPPTQTPASGVGGSPFAPGGSGVGFGLVLALLISLAAFALQGTSRLRLPPGQWRSFTHVAVIERPG